MYRERENLYVMSRAVPFVPIPTPKTVCRTYLHYKWVQYEVCRTCLGRGMGINITAHILSCLSYICIYIYI